MYVNLYKCVCVMLPDFLPLGQQTKGALGFGSVESSLRGVERGGFGCADFFL